MRSLFGRQGQPIDDELADRILDSPQGRHVEEMMTYTAVGTPGAVRHFLDRFAEQARADELMTVHHAADAAGRVRSLELLAEVSGLVPA